MKQQKWSNIIAVSILMLCAALPQLLLYYKGYYYVTSAPALVKYPVNAGCYLGVALAGYWYLHKHPPALLAFFWTVLYFVGGVIVAAQYLYHFIYPGWGTQTYLNTMGLFEILVSPMPFIIAWLLLRLVKSLAK